METTIRFDQVTRHDPETGDAQIETVQVPVSVDGETFAIGELPRGGAWSCNHVDLIKFLVAGLPQP